MANPARKEVEIVLGGVTYVTRPTFARMTDFESRVGKVWPVIKLLQANDYGLTDIVTMVTVLMRGVPGAPSPKEIGDLVVEAGMVSFIGPIMTFLSYCLQTDEPKPAGGAEGN